MFNLFKKKEVKLEEGKVYKATKDVYHILKVSSDIIVYESIDSCGMELFQPNVCTRKQFLRRIDRKAQPGNYSDIKPFVLDHDAEDEEEGLDTDLKNYCVGDVDATLRLQDKIKIAEFEDITRRQENTLTSLRSTIGDLYRKINEHETDYDRLYQAFRTALKENYEDSSVAYNPEWWLERLDDFKKDS